MAKHDKEEEAWEKAYDEWQASLNDGKVEEGGEVQ